MFKSATVAMSLMSLANAAISVSKTGTTVNVNGISYYVGVDAMATIQIKRILTNADLVPLTVMSSSDDIFTPDSFKSLVSNYTASDDVFNTGFLEGVYNLQPQCKQSLTPYSCPHCWLRQY